MKQVADLDASGVWFEYLCDKCYALCVPLCERRVCVLSTCVINAMHFVCLCVRELSIVCSLCTCV